MTGAVTLLRETPHPRPQALRPQLRHYRYDGHDGTGLAVERSATASDLKGFGSREWIAACWIPERISTPQYFGGTKFKDGKMAKFIHRDVPTYSAEDKAKLHAVTLAVSAEAQLDGQARPDAAIPN